MATDNATMVKDAVQEINEDSERNARSAIRYTIQDIRSQQDIIEKATLKIFELKIKLKGITYKETDIETVS